MTIQFLVAAVGLDHLGTLWIERGWKYDAIASVDTSGHAKRVTCRGAVAIERKTHEFHSDEFAELAGELEPDLVPAMIGRRCSPDIGGELGTSDHLVADRRDIMLPTSGTEE